VQHLYYIPKTNLLPPGEDFDLLYDKGLEWIRQFSSDKWTDYNLHDPGITILEIVAYTLTELGYKSSFPVHDILADENGDVDLHSMGLFTAREILPSAPVTAKDYRKFLIDLDPHVMNAWVSPDGDTGRYSAAVLLEQGASEDDVVAGLTEALSAVRNVGEQVGSISILKKQQQTFAIDIDIEKGSRAEEVVALVLYRIATRLQPRIHFYTLGEMQKRGIPTTEIFDGPALQCGFIDDSDLDEQPTSVKVNELIQIIRNTKGVIRLNSISPGEDLPAIEDTIYTLNITQTLNAFTVRIDGNAVTISQRTMNNYYRQLESTSNRSFRLDPARSPLDYPAPTGKYGNFADYYSLQNSFPYIYGIGERGLSSTSSDQRKAQANQLKAYLLFFEQVIANFLGQLENIRSVYSIEKQTSTYFFNPLYKVPRIPSMLASFTSYVASIPDLDEKILQDERVWDSLPGPTQEYVRKGTDAMTDTEDFSTRRNDILDFLLGMYSEQLPVYSSSSGAFDGDGSDITVKETYLRHYDTLSRDRGTAGSFSSPGGPESNLRALLNIPNRPSQPIYNLISSVFSIRKVPEGTDPEKVKSVTQDQYTFAGDNKSIYNFFKMAADEENYQVKAPGMAPELTLDVDGGNIKLAPIRKSTNTYGAFRKFQRSILRLSDLSDNFYVVDHSDLSGYPADESEVGRDFYMYRMSYIFPGFTLRFGEAGYRRYVESLIFQYTPAHIRAYVSWLEFDQLRDFEQLYYNLKAAVSIPAYSGGLKNSTIQMTKYLNDLQKGNQDQQ